MQVKKVEHDYTWTGDVTNAVYVFIPFGLVFSVISASTSSKSAIAPFAIIMALVIIALIFIRKYKVDRFLNDRSAQLVAIAAQRNYHYYPELTQYTQATHESEIEKITLSSITERDLRFRNFIVAPDWTYFDFSYGHYRKTKYGEYKAADVYYSVLRIPLARQLPNVFFDSKHARSRQFRFFFKRRQIYHFEGDFEDYFTAYLPQGYELDSLSFLTPDVLQALKNASNYDAEIIGSSLYLYGPISNAALEINDMSKNALEIKNTLSITTRDYIDEHVASNLGSTEVSPQAAALARSHFWLYVQIAAFVLYIIFRIVLSR